MLAGDYHYTSPMGAPNKLHIELSGIFPVNIRFLALDKFCDIVFV
jgi:hypothetical protein